ncbi:MAG: cation:proton antiporter [Mariprofundaceae bacterium]
MADMAEFLVTLGSLLLLGLATDAIGRRTALPRISLLLLFGFLIGPSAFDLLPAYAGRWFPSIAEMALLIIGFLLGGKLTLKFLHRHGRSVLYISVAEVLVTALVMMIGLLAIGVPFEMALLLAGIAPATAPEADIVREIGARGNFARTMLGVMALDDVWTLIIFGFLLTAFGLHQGEGTGLQLLFAGVWELGGAMLLGIVLGLPAAYLTGRIRPGEPTLSEAIGIVFLCGGIAFWLGFSYLLAVIILGGVIANFASHHIRPFHAIEGIEWPFLVLFFVLAGASFKPEVFGSVWLAGLAYIILRAGGRLLGGWSGGRLSHARPMIRRWMGVALMPQAGVATGLALIAANRFPDIGDQILAIVVVGTVIFEMAGPVLTRHALRQAGTFGDKKPR